MSEMIYKIPLRKKEYDVIVEDSAGPSTIMWFKYCNTKMVDDVYIPEELEYQEIIHILTEKVKTNIKKYNHRMYMRKICKQRKQELQN